MDVFVDMYRMNAYMHTDFHIYMSTCLYDHVSMRIFFDFSIQICMHICTWMYL